MPCPAPRPMPLRESQACALPAEKQANKRVTKQKELLWKVERS